MTKEQVEALIDKLADKSLSFGCVFRRKCDEAICIYIGKSDPPFITNYIHPNLQIPGGLLISEIDILGHPVYIGDVLERMKEEYLSDPIGWLEMLFLWSICGFRKSLQEVAEDLKDFNARALFEFLATIFNK
jgi:hypothetical protein